MRIRLEVDGHVFDLALERAGEAVVVESEGQRLEARVRIEPEAVQVDAFGALHDVRVVGPDDAQVDGRPLKFRVAGFEPGAPAATRDGRRATPIHAMMHGRLARVLVSAGQAVTRGQPLFILEAMKMQNELQSPTAGRVTRLAVEEGQVVESGRLLAELEPEGLAPA